MVELTPAAAIRAGLAAAGDPGRAASQRAYLKSALPCRGVSNQGVRRVVAEVLRGPVGEIGSAGEWEWLIRSLWAAAEFREERFAALQVGRYRRHRAYAERTESLPLYEELIRQGAWWDLVDETAHLVEGVLIAHPETTAAVLRRWAGEPDLWVRRVAITAQLHRGRETDRALLAEAIAGSAPDPDFFARKAIGWALRQYARTDPDWVRRFVAEHPELSPLSRREALKHL